MKSIIAIIACALLLGSCKPDSPEEKSASLLSEVSTEVLPDRDNIRVTLEKAQAGDAEGAWELGRFSICSPRICTFPMRRG